MVFIFEYFHAFILSVVCNLGVTTPRAGITKLATIVSEKGSRAAFKMPARSGQSHYFGQSSTIAGYAPKFPGRRDCTEAHSAEIGWAS